MGRQLRKVAANWQHPKDKSGNYIPLLDGKFSERLAKWEEENAQWEKGFRDDWSGGWKPKEADELNLTFAEWSGEKPVKEDYMPEWKDEELTHIQLYENTTEGTPISPVYLASEIEKLCEYAAENCSTFADFKATKDEWRSMLDKDFVHHTQGNITFI